MKDKMEGKANQMWQGWQLLKKWAANTGEAEMPIMGNNAWSNASPLNTIKRIENREEQKVSFSVFEGIWYDGSFNICADLTVISLGSY